MNFKLFYFFIEKNFIYLKKKFYNKKLNIIKENKLIEIIMKLLLLILE